MCQVLSTQELMYQNSNVYCWQTMIKTGCLVLFRLAQSCSFYEKLESSCCRIKCAFRPGSIDQISGRIFFLQIFPTQPQPIKTCRVLCFALGKRQTLATFLRLFYFAVCVNLCEIQRWLPSHVLRIIKKEISLIA